MFPNFPMFSLILIFSGFILKKYEHKTSKLTAKAFKKSKT